MEASGLCVVTANQFLAVSLWKISFSFSFSHFLPPSLYGTHGIYLAVLALSRL